MALVAVLTVLVGLAPSPASALSACPSFESRADHAINGATVGVAAADFDSDGTVDLAVTSYAASSVSVLLGTGDGSFAAPVSYRVPQAIAVVAADFDNDGILDLAVSGFGWVAVTLLHGSGNGTFTGMPAIASVERGYGLASGDLNGDGNIDVVTSNPGPDTASVFLGDGHGQFAPEVEYPVGTEALSVTIGDVDGDDVLDMVTSDWWSNTVSILLGHGDGTFGARTTYAAGAAPLDVAIADLDGDGAADLVVANSTDLIVLLGVGDGTFTSTTYDADGGPVGVTVADLTGDGILDIATAEQPARVGIFVGDGTGAFSHGPSLAAAAVPVRVTSADFDGDGSADLAVTDQSADLASVFLNDSSCAPVAAVMPVLTAEDPPAATVGVRYTYTYAATGDPAPTFAVTAGTLPAGIALDATSGELSGTPTAGGSSSFTVAATNTAGSATSDDIIDVATPRAGDPPTVTPVIPTVPVVPPAVVATETSGTDRIATAIAASRDTFAPTGVRLAADVGPSLAARSVVLARADSYADALVGTAFAVHEGAPLLLTWSSTLDDRVVREIRRVLGESGTVHLLGGTDALSADVESQLRAAGFTVDRLAGADRASTAVAVAHALGDPAVVMEATGEDFPDALAAGAVAAHIGAAVLLTDGATQAVATRAYLDAHPDTTRYAVGAPAAVADPGATAIVGADRYDTAAKVADAFFADPTDAGLASGADFPDALAGGVHIGHRDGPMLLTSPAELSAPTAAYLAAHRATIARTHIYGGAAAIGQTTRDTLAAVLR
jgi:putative cell wall-binding protein